MGFEGGVLLRDVFLIRHSKSFAEEASQYRLQFSFSSSHCLCYQFLPSDDPSTMEFNCRYLKPAVDVRKAYLERRCYKLEKMMAGMIFDQRKLLGLCNIPAHLFVEQNEFSQIAYLVFA